MIGTTRGARKRPVSNPRPGKLPRVMPRAASVPSTVARMAVAKAVSTLTGILSVHCGFVKSSEYQRNDSPSGGNASVDELVKLIGTTIRIGASRTAAVSTAHARHSHCHERGVTELHRTTCGGFHPPSGHERQSPGW